MALNNMFYSSQMLREIMQYVRRTGEAEASHNDVEIAEKIKEIKEKYKKVVIFDKKEDTPTETPDNVTPPKTPRKKKNVIVNAETTSQE